MRLNLASLFAASALAASGCFIESSDNPPPPPAPAAVAEGTLTVDWTINGTTDPNQCAQGSATDIEITVYVASGGTAGTYQQACSAFATSISLAPGSYTASAVLLDGAGNERTTAVAINPFTIHGNDVLDIPVDFPASSFR